MAAVETSESHSPEDYLTQRTRGFGDPEAFNEMRNWCSAEITSAAYKAGGVLDGCVTPVYDDWTVHQALRIMARMQPLEMDNDSDLELHLSFVSDCMKFLYLNLSLGEYAIQVCSFLSLSNPPFLPPPPPPPPLLLLWKREKKSGRRECEEGAQVENRGFEWGPRGSRFGAGLDEGKGGEAHKGVVGDRQGER